MTETPHDDKEPDDSWQPRIPPEKTRVVFGGLLLVILLAALDQTIVSTALPKVISDLNGLDRYSWVATAYLLCSTVTIPLYGKLSDLFGRKRILMFGIFMFLRVGMVWRGSIYEPAHRGAWLSRHRCRCVDACSVCCAGRPFQPS